MIAPKVGRAPAPNAGAAAADPPSGDGAAPNPPPAGSAPMGLRAPPAGAAPKLPHVAGAGEGWYGTVLPVPAAAAPPKTGAELTTKESKRPSQCGQCARVSLNHKDPSGAKLAGALNWPIQAPHSHTTRRMATFGMEIKDISRRSIRFASSLEP